MSWLTLAKFLAPIVLIAAIYFYAHDAGWKERDGLVQGEIDKAVAKAVGGERDSCKTKLSDMGRINNDLSNAKDATANLYADAIGKLYDTNHRPDPGAGMGGSTSIDHETAGDNRLYYTNPAAARSLIERDRIASDQASQLIGCQSYINTGKAAEAAGR